MSLFYELSNFEHTDESEYSDDRLEVSRPEIGEKFETEEESFEDCLKSDTQGKISENMEVDEKEDFEQIEKTQGVQNETSDFLDEESFDDVEKTEDDIDISDKYEDVIQTGEESPAKPFESEQVDEIKPAFASIEENEEETLNREIAEKETLPEKERDEGTERSQEGDLEKTTKQKIEDIRDVDGVSLSYLTELRNENVLKLDSEQQKYEAQKQEAVDVYSQMIDGKTSREELTDLQDRYQNLRQEIGNTRSRMEELESGSDMINEKLDRTRQEMIEDGVQACENTKLEQTLANELHEGYNEIYYDEKASLEELKDLANRNRSLIDEMVSDRERIEGAKEAKMSQIRDYGAV